MAGLITTKRIKALLGLLAAYKVYKKMLPTRVKTVNGKRVLVTGAASGVGRLLVLELVRQGANVVAWDVQAAPLEETREMALAQYPRADVVTMVCNLADADDIRANCAKVLADTANPIDVIINNAGVISGKYLEQIPDSKIDLTMQVNAIAHIHIAKAFLPQMMERNSGHILCVASMAGLIGASGMTDYAASKFAARGFMEALAVELHERGIDGVKCSVIAPTLIDTGLFKGFKVPLNPTLQTIEVVHAVIDAYEYERELVCVPGWLAVSGIGFKAMLGLDQQLGFKTPFASPMKDFDDTQASQAFQAIANASQAKL